MCITYTYLYKFSKLLKKNLEENCTFDTSIPPILIFQSEIEIHSRGNNNSKPKLNNFDTR